MAGNFQHLIAGSAAFGLGSWPVLAPSGSYSGMAWLGNACTALASTAACFALFACSTNDDDAALSKLSEEDDGLTTAPPPSENGPKLGSIANLTPIHERPRAASAEIGYLHAGARIARSNEPVKKTKQCPNGYFSVFPRGFVCLDQGATLDLRHPTLTAMAIQPSLDQPLPYTYARTRTETSLLERDPGQADAVRETRKLAKGTGLAVVGSWSARVSGGEPERLGLLANGRFVRAEDLSAANPSSFEGHSNREQPLRVAFVVKRGVRGWKLGELPEKGDLLDYHSRITLTGKNKTIDGVKYFQAGDALWVRHQDVTSPVMRFQFPEFVRDGVRWIDVSVLTGLVVLYEGKQPVFVTLGSVGRDRLGDPAAIDHPQAVSKLGTFEVTAKHITYLAAEPDRAGERYPVFDLPWVLELSSGQLIYGSYVHDRFGIEYGPGDITLSPADARRVFDFATPVLPAGWHGARAHGEKTFVVVRK
jgi:hypothetical protein